jgi:hypothetical protein
MKRDASELDSLLSIIDRFVSNPCALTLLLFNRHHEASFYFLWSTLFSHLDFLDLDMHPIWLVHTVCEIYQDLSPLRTLTLDVDGPF